MRTCTSSSSMATTRAGTFATMCLTLMRATHVLKRKATCKLGVAATLSSSPQSFTYLSTARSACQVAQFFHMVCGLKPG